MVTDTPVLGRAFLAEPGFHSRGSLVVALAITAVFAIDCVMPLGFGIPFFYIPILWVALAWATPRQALAIAAASSALSVVALFSSPEGNLPIGLTNRAITLFAL